MKWSMSDIERLHASGKILDYKDISANSVKDKPKK